MKIIDFCSAQKIVFSTVYNLQGKVKRVENLYFWKMEGWVGLGEGLTDAFC